MEQLALAHNDSGGDALVHDVFLLTLLTKAAAGIFEVIVGFALLFFNVGSIHKLLLASVSNAVVKNSNRVATNFVINQANHFSLSTKYFLAAYFLFYGIVNLFLVISLFKGKLWAYPVAIWFFSFFICYQWYRFSLHYSWLLLFFTLLDMGLVTLTWLEYQRAKKSKRNLLKISQ